MRTISLRTLREFWEKHRDAEDELRQWYRVARAATWRRFQDVRRVYADVDMVDAADGAKFLVFNICHNDYRLVARIRFDQQVMVIRGVMTHREYDQENWKA
jgi:mRNA interferase HigB